MSETLRILVVDDDHNMARTLMDILRLENYDVEIAHSGPDALGKLTVTPFDCVLSDIKMPESSGVELCRTIKVKHPELPIVLMTAYSSDNLVQEGLTEGAIAALTKPLDIPRILRFFSSLRRDLSIVIVDDDPSFREAMQEVLQFRGFSVTQIINPYEVMERLRTDEEVVLLDMRLEHTSGLEILREIRKRHPHLPVILVTGYEVEMASAIEAALQLNAYTCLYKPFKIEQLLQLLADVRHQELQRILGQPVRKKINA